MKNFLLIIILSLALFSCTETPQILQSACSVTNDICNYANLICANLPNKNITAAQEQNYILRLTAINNSLKSTFEKSEVRKLDKSASEVNADSEALMSARNQLKKITDELDLK